MTVVAASVHQAGPRRHVRDVVLLQDRERIHVGAKHDHLAGPRAVQPGDDRRPGGSLDLETAERAERLLDEVRRLVLLERELGIRVQMPPPRDRACLEIVGDESLARCRGRHEE